MKWKRAREQLRKDGSQRFVGQNSGDNWRSLARQPNSGLVSVVPTSRFLNAANSACVARTSRLIVPTLVLFSRDANTAGAASDPTPACRSTDDPVTGIDTN